MVAKKFLRPYAGESGLGRPSAPPLPGCATHLRPIERSAPHHCCMAFRCFCVSNVVSNPPVGCIWIKTEMGRQVTPHSSLILTTICISYQAQRYKSALLRATAAFYSCHEPIFIPVTSYIHGAIPGTFVGKHNRCFEPLSWRPFRPHPVKRIFWRETIELSHEK